MRQWILLVAAVVAVAASLFIGGLFASADSDGRSVRVIVQQLPTTASSPTPAPVPLPTWAPATDTYNTHSVRFYWEGRTVNGTVVTVVSQAP